MNSSFSTYLNDTEVTKIIAASGNVIRQFLDFIIEQQETSIYWPLEGELDVALGNDPEWDAVIPLYKDNSQDFSDEKMVEYGDCHLSSHTNPIRIEVRTTDGVAGAAQIAVRGIAGDFRDLALAEFEKQGLLEHGHIVVKKGGHKSFEFNIADVTKALPIDYLHYHWDDLLEQMRYTPGSKIDASKTKTIIAADGDGTIYAKPHMDDLPGLNESVVKPSLNEFLALGGVFMLVTGNSLARSAPRIADAIDDALKCRVLVAANGGADLAFFDEKNNLVSYEHYRENALADFSSAKAQLDLIYVGDDGDPVGNDYDAFKHVGFDRSILVGRVHDGADSNLEKHCVGSFEEGAKAFFDAVNGHINEPLTSNLFTEGNINVCVDKARELLKS